MKTHFFDGSHRFTVHPKMRVGRWQGPGAACGAGYKHGEFQGKLPTTEKHGEVTCKRCRKSDAFQLSEPYDNINCPSCRHMTEQQLEQDYHDGIESMWCP